MKSSDTSLFMSERAPQVFLTVGVLLYLLAFPTEPLFFGNQVTKFLFGMRWAGVGHLEHDWTANTRYGLPVFGSLIYAIYASGMPWLTYVVQAGLIVLFALAAHGIARAWRGATTWRELLHVDRYSLLFFAPFVVLSLGYPARIWYGVAHQTTIGPDFETASFGILFFVSVLLYLAGRKTAAIALTIPTALIHPGYILPGTILIGGFVVADWATRNQLPRRYWITIALALVSFVAHTVYLRLHFLPTSPALSERANTIITEGRLPEITMVRVWVFSMGTLIKVPVVMLAIWLARKQPIGQILGVGFLAVTALTLAQAISGSHLFALIEPWRASIWIAPIALIVLIAWAADWFDRQILARTAGAWRTALLAGMFVLPAAGISYGAYDKATSYPRHIKPYEEYLKRNATDQTQILAPLDLLALRVNAEAPVYVSEKTHPYQDFEVLEWNRRMQLAGAIYKPQAVDCGALQNLVRAAHLTHMVVLRPDQRVDCAFARTVYRDGDAKIYAFTL